MFQYEIDELTEQYQTIQKADYKLLQRIFHQRHGQWFAEPTRSMLGGDGKVLQSQTKKC